MEARFIHVVEIGQYFMIKYTEEQFFTRACREYTLPRNDESSQPKRWIQETQELDPYWKSRPVICTVNMELKSESGLWVKISSPSWVRISHGSNKFVIDSNYNNTKKSCRSTWRTSVTINCESLCSQIKRESKNHKEENQLIYRTSFRWMNEKSIDIEPVESHLSAYEISKKVINLLRHSQTVQREDDEAIQFWRIKNYLRNQFPQTQYWSDDRWKACMAAGGGAKKEISILHWYFRNNSLFPSSSRTFRTQSHWFFITGQCDNSELILPNIFTT